MLNRVCRDYRAWQNEVPKPGRIAINLSLKQLRQAELLTRCRSVFDDMGVSPSNFELEITETTLMAEASRIVRLLNELHAMGLHLSIDDFGTGYSSLSALQQFPVGTLKIDQSFVRDATVDRGRRDARAHDHRDGQEPRSSKSSPKASSRSSNSISCAAGTAIMARAGCSASR